MGSAAAWVSAAGWLLSAKWGLLAIAVALGIFIWQRREQRAKDAQTDTNRRNARLAAKRSSYSSVQADMDMPSQS